MKKESVTHRESGLAPLQVIEQAIELIITGKILDYRFDRDNGVIIEK